MKEQNFFKKAQENETHTGFDVEAKTVAFAGETS